MLIRWLDWGNTALGAWLIASPRLFEFTLDHYASGNAFGFGALLVIYNVMIASRLIDEGQEIVNLILGVWLLLSPFALGFDELKVAALDTSIVGGAIVVLAAWGMTRGVQRTN